MVFLAAPRGRHRLLLWHMPVVFLLLLWAASLLQGCSEKKPETLSAQELIAEGADATHVPVLVFTDTVFDFGTVTAGGVVKHSFVFENKGEAPLLISNAQASCGCTVPTYPKEPIPPGGKSKIDVEFNSTGRSGAQNKVVTLFANTLPPTKELRLTGEVKPNPADMDGPTQ